MKYLLRISYDGSKFYGFQRLNNKITVQGTLESVLSKFFKEDIFVKGAGRTDRGVHALDQCCHFSTTCNIDPYRLRKVINDRVGNYIFVNKCEVIDNDFHARFDVSKKVYTYKINLGDYNPILQDYVYNLNHSLDIERMYNFSKLLLGEHSYKYFVSDKRENYDSGIYDIEFNYNDKLLTIVFTGKHFYLHMVRNLVGFLIAVGKGKYNETDIIKIFNDEIVDDYYSCAPSNGLYLTKIVY